MSETGQAMTTGVDYLDEFLRQALDVMVRKGRDYRNGGELLSNFDRRAADSGATPEQVWSVLAGKGWDAIMSYCRTRQVASEPIEQRLIDNIVYSLLLYAMVVRRRDEKIGGGKEAEPDAAPAPAPAARGRARAPRATLDDCEEGTVLRCEESYEDENSAYQSGQLVSIDDVYIRDLHRWRVVGTIK